MLRDFDMIKHDFRGGNDITIIPISDVHLGAAECQEQDFIAFVNKVKETENVYLTLGGDLINNAIKSSVSNIYDEIYRPSEAKKMMAKILEPVRDRILCAVGGNHERRSSKDVDDDITYDIMAKLDLEHLYRENIAFVKIQLGTKITDTGNRPKGPDRPTYMLAVTHGAGGGILTGAGVNKAEQYGRAIDGIDLLILGHTHKPYTTQPGKIVVDPHNNKVVVKPFRVVSATSWLEYSGYAAQKMLLPTTFCLQEIYLSGKEKKLSVSM